MYNNIVYTFYGFLMKNRGFTLAEVLITLGIIGVVAAITIPTVLQNSQDKQTISALKKAYSTLTQAFNMSIQDNGNPTSWGIDVDYRQALKKMIPYLKIMKDCSDGSAGCFPNVTYGSFNESAYNNISDENYNSATYPKVQLADGTLIVVPSDHMGETSAICNNQFGPTDSLKNECYVYYVDINGFKGPNEYGIDTFAFYLTKSGIVPAGTQAEDNYTPSSFSFIGYCTGLDGSATLPEKSGLGCTAWVIENENFDYRKCRTSIGWDGQTNCN